MHKKKVTTVFLLLALFGIGLFVFQIYHFGSLTGSSTFDSLEKSGDLPFGVRINSLSGDNGQLRAELVLSSAKPEMIDVYAYAVSDGNVVGVQNDRISVSETTDYEVNIKISDSVTSEKSLVFYASDGQYEMKFTKTVPGKSITSRAIDSAESNPLYTGVAFIAGCCVILFIIVVGILVNKHRKESRRLAFSPRDRHFLEFSLR
jgi:hypothetical protein